MVDVEEFAPMTSPASPLPSFARRARPWGMTNEDSEMEQMRKRREMVEAKDRASAKAQMQHIMSAKSAVAGFSNQLQHWH